MMVKAVSTYRAKLNAVRNHARLNLAIAVSYLLALLLINSWACAAEPPTKEVLRLCRSELLTERETLPVDRGSTKPLPSDYRQAIRFELTGNTVLGWLTHSNSNGSSTIVVRTVDRETKETGFLVLVKDGTVSLKHDVAAFEFAFSKREHNGVTGLFFCNKEGPSAEWVWDGKDWQIAK